MKYDKPHFMNRLAKILLPSWLYWRLVNSSIAKRLAKGSLWGVLGSVCSRIMVLASMILVARILGKESFGELGLIQSTLGVAGLMAGLGLGATATRFVAQYVLTDPARAGSIIALITQITWGTVLFTVAGIMLFSEVIANTLLGAPHLHIALNWGSLFVVANVLRGVQSGIIAGLERFDVIAKLNILDGIVSLAATIGFATYFGVIGALIGLAFGPISVWIAGRFILSSTLKDRDIFIKHRNCWQDWRVLSCYSLPNFLAHLTAIPVLWYCMTIVAHTSDGYGKLGIYNAAYQWHGPIIFVPMILMSTSIPVMVQAWESGQNQKFRSIMLWVYGVTLLISLPLVLLIGALSPWVMSFYGPGFSEGWQVLLLLLGAAPFHAISKIASGALLGMNRAWWVLSVNLLWGVTILSLTLLLVPKFGVNGLATAFLSAYVVLAFSSVVLAFVGSKKPVKSIANLAINKGGSV